MLKQTTLWITSVIVSLYVHPQLSSLHRFRCCITATLSLYVISIRSHHYFTGMKISLISVLRYTHLAGGIDITGKRCLTRRWDVISQWSLPCVTHTKTGGACDEHEKIILTAHPPRLASFFYIWLFSQSDIIATEPQLPQDFQGFETLWNT